MVRSRMRRRLGAPHTAPGIGLMNKVIATGQFTFDPARALSNAAFRDAEWHAAEKRNIWRGDWVFITTEDALPEPGDQLPVKVGDQPVLLLRNRAGHLAALSNLCAHRGTLLVEEPANGTRIQCPYHAWTYDDAGRLLGAPFAPKDRFDKAAHSLPAYRVDTQDACGEASGCDALEHALNGPRDWRCAPPRSGGTSRPTRSSPASSASA